jgi:hypothetical protein
MCDRMNVYIYVCIVYCAVLTWMASGSDRSSTRDGWTATWQVYCHHYCSGRSNYRSSSSSSSSSSSILAIVIVVMVVFAIRVEVVVNVVVVFDVLVICFCFC